MVSVASPDNDAIREIKDKEGQRGSSTDTNTIASPTLDKGLVDNLKQSEATPPLNSSPPVRKSAFSMPKLRSKKWFLIGGLAGGGGIFAIGLVILVIFIAGLLKIPGLADNITRYESIAVTREFRSAVSRSVNESSSLASANDETYKSWEERFSGNSVASKTLRSIYARLAKIKPNLILEALGQDKTGTLKFKTRIGFAGREVLQSVIIGDIEYAIKPAIGDVVPGVKFYKQAVLWNTVKPKILAKMDVYGVPKLARGPAMIKLRGLFGGGGWLSAWDLAAFKDAKNGEQSRIIEQRQVGAKVNDAAQLPNNETTELLKKATDDASEAERQAIKAPLSDTAANADIVSAVKNNGFFDRLKNIIQDRLNPTFFNKALEITDPVLGIAIPVCMIYDGSVKQSAPAIDNSANRARAAYYYVQSASSQLETGTKYGANPVELNKAIGATSDQLRDTTEGNPYRRTAGSTIDTLSAGGLEFGGGGTSNYYDVFNALGVPHDSPVGNITQYIISNHVCEALTNTGVAVVISIANIGLAIATAGGSEAAAEGGVQTVRIGFVQATKAALTHALRTESKKVFVNGIEKTIEVTAGNRIKNFLIRQGLTIGGIEAGTFVAHMLVASHAGVLQSGLSQGADFANLADAGGSVVYRDLSQTTGGRVLSNDEVAARDAVSTQQLAFEDTQKSVSERYFSLANPRSLATTAVMNIASAMKPTFFANMATRLSDVISQPLTTFGSFLSSFGIAHAAPDPNTQHYGVVQFGWSEDEQKLIDSNESYLSLQNQIILDQSGKEDEIAQKYAACFGYKYNSSGDSFDQSDENSKLQLDVAGDSSVGNLLGNGLIVRDESGKVLNDGNIDHCTPDNLGAHNSLYGDLVLRFRLAMQYSAASNQLINFQTVTQ